MGRWGLGAVAWLWAGGAGAEAQVRQVENRETARLPVRTAIATAGALRGPERAVRFAGAPAPESRSFASNQQGDPSWRKGRPASPDELQVTPSTQAAQAGEQISVKVSASEGAAVRAEIFRLGVYGGTGALKVWSGGPYHQTFSFEVSRDWEPGLYLVKVTLADGARSFTSIVVKAPPPAGPRS
jgi:hypothetical protein